MDFPDAFGFILEISEKIVAFAYSVVIVRGVLTRGEQMRFIAAGFTNGCHGSTGSYGFTATFFIAIV